MLSPTQIQKLISNYAVADYEVRDWTCTDRPARSTDAGACALPPQTPISSEVLKAVASRVMANDRNDHLLLPPESDEVGPFECPLPRNIEDLYTYIPAWCVRPDRSARGPQLADSDPSMPTGLMSRTSGRSRPCWTPSSCASGLDVLRILIDLDLDLLVFRCARCLPHAQSRWPVCTFYSFGAIIDQGCQSRYA